MPQFAEAVVNLKFDEEPKYQAFMALFDPLCGPQPQRPILTDGQSKVLQRLSTLGRGPSGCKLNLVCLSSVSVLAPQA